MNNKTKIFLQALAVFGLAIAINFVGYLNKKHNSIGSELVEDMCPQHRWRVGAVLAKIKGGDNSIYLVMGVVEGSAAQRYGLKKYDILLAPDYIADDQHPGPVPVRVLRNEEMFETTIAKYMYCF